MLFHFPVANCLESCIYSSMKGNGAKYLLNTTRRKLHSSKPPELHQYCCRKSDSNKNRIVPLSFKVLELKLSHFQCFSTFAKTGVLNLPTLEGNAANSSRITFTAGRKAARRAHTGPAFPPKQSIIRKTRKPKIDLELEEKLKELDEKYSSIKSSLQTIFPFPKNNLHNAYAIVSSQLGAQHTVQFVYNHVSQAPACWQCSVAVEWPSVAQFTSCAASKAEAAHRASLDALQWLQSIGKLNQKGEVELMTRMNRQTSKQAPVAEIQLSKESLESIENIVNKYYEEVAKINKLPVNKAMEPQTISDGDKDLETDTLPIQREKWLFPHVADRRDLELFRRYERTKERHDKFSSVLPIHHYKEEIVRLVNNNSVVVIKGEPGCGKSTQVPQYIMESYAARQAATDCNVVVTQPRRISAIALAERVAHERNEWVGDVVGYHVRLHAKHPRYQDGYILFCSTGMLVRKMIGDSALQGVSHVIVDEAHERDTYVDFLLLLLKRALQLNPSLKIIIMSATINAELFTRFFNDCPSISIPGFTYPVEPHFLDDRIKSMLEKQGVTFETDDVERPVVNIEAVVRMVTWIDENKPEGAILVFLPGWVEIRTVMEELAALSCASHFMVVPAHSKLSSEDQKRIFERPSGGRRKVILSTNIAETSLTIDDVVYVIDSGAVKEERMDLKSGLVCLDNQWASQANVLQRRGRAGRVRPGESYHLFTEDMFRSLDQFPTPMIKRIPLTRSVLDVKMYTTDENITQFLSCLPEPPGEEAVSQAMGVLQSMGALDMDENLTPLGKRIYKFPLDPYLSKALVHACILKCVSPILTIATLLAADYSMFENTLGLKGRVRLVKQRHSPASDHIASARLYHEWEYLDWASPAESRNDCQQKGLSYRNMDRTRQLRRLHAELLNATRLIPESENVNDMSTASNQYSHYDELVKSILLSGLGKLLVFQKPLRKRGISLRTLDGSPAVISSESVNSKFKELPTPFLTYYKSLSSAERRAVIVHESSLLSPVSVVLFMPGVVTLKNMAGLESDKSVLSVEGSKPVYILVKQKEGEQLLHLRQVIWNVLEYLVEHEGRPKDVEQYKSICQFRDDLLPMFQHMLMEGEQLLHLRQVIWNVLEYLVEHEGRPRDVEQYKSICQFRDDLLPVLANLTSQEGANIDFTESGELRTEPPSDRMQSG